MNKLLSRLNTKVELKVNPKVALVAGAFVLVVVLYVAFIRPLLQAIDEKEQAVNRLSTDVFHLQNTLNETTAPQDVSAEVYKIRKKIPNQSAIDQLLLQLEEIEYVSKVRIERVLFNNYDAAPSEQMIFDVSETNVSGSEADKNSVGLEDEPTNPMSTIDLSALPQALKLMTYELNVIASSEEHMERFIKEIEQLERSMKVEAINYQLPGEGEVVDKDALVVNVTIQVSTFYYEGER